MPLFLGLDIGTSATKAVVMDDAGRTRATAAAEYPLVQPRPGWIEQHPQDWWQAVRSTLHALNATVSLGDVTAIGLSGQMHGSGFLDEASLRDGGREGRVLRPALLWNDQRTAAECDEIERAVGGRRRLVELVGNAALPGFTLPKILWLRRHEPETFARVARVLMPKDYIRWRLTGEAMTDVGDASGTLLFDPARRAWSNEVASAVDVDLRLVPPALESRAIAGHVTEFAALATGLTVGTPVIAGSGDNMMGAIGAGIVREGDVVVTLGTSGVIYAHSSVHRPDVPDQGRSEGNAALPGRTHAMCSATGADAWCITGCMLSAGGALHWCREAMFPGATYDELLAEAAVTPIGAEGLLFLPHLTGERCPHPDPSARGAWVGLTARHTRGHLVRALVEGVTFTLGQILDIMRSQGLGPTHVRLGGGGARSPFWRQLCADVFALPVVTTTADEGPAFGAAILAATAVGQWPDVAIACDATIDIAETREPDPSAARLYGELRCVHGELHHQLRPTTAVLSEFASRPK